MRSSSKEEIIKFLGLMPCALEFDDVPDFCSLAQYYALKNETRQQCVLASASHRLNKKIINVV